MATPTPTPSPSHKPIRLAILETDIPLPQIDAIYHNAGYYGVFQSMFSRCLLPSPPTTSAPPLESILSLSKHTVVSDPSPAAYPSLSDIDALLITGSRHNAFADDDWIVALTEYVRRALTYHETTAEGAGRVIRVVGVCFGHQIVGRALGVLVDRSDSGWEVSVTEMRLSERGRELFGGRDTLKLQQMHRDQVFGLPAGAELLAETDICANQGFLIPGRVMTIQGHPEFTSTIMRELLETRKDQGLFTPELYASGTERNVDEQDGLLVARAFIKFLQE